jgi:ribosome-associated heat shock protein Hsp15
LPASDPKPAAGRQRLDKWLWFARVVKTREAAAALVENGNVRLNRVKVIKPGHDVKQGDVLTIILNTRVRVLHVEGFAARRGPAGTAEKLYREPAWGAAMPSPDEALPQKGDASEDGSC